jgi:hypothetical protein
MNKKNILIIIVAVIFLGIVFIYLTRDNTAGDTSSLSTNVSTAPSADAQYIYNLLQRMSAVKLDDSIFVSTAFQSLIDNTVVLTAQQTGRNNPFSPIGTDTGIFIQATTTTTRSSR